MTTPQVRFFVCLLACFLVLAHVDAAASEPSQQATVAAEPSGPAPSAAVEKMLSESRRLAEAKQPLDSLKAADQALEAARQTKDRAGEALAQQARAKALQDLERTDEALAVWQEAAQMWARAGDTPEEITALVKAGLLCVPDKKSEAERLFSQGLAVAKIASQRPLAVAQALYDSGSALDVPRGADPVQSKAQASWDYFSAALAIREKLAPKSLKVEESLNAMVKVMFDRARDPNVARQYYSMAKDYSTRAVEIGQRVAPDSATLSKSLQWLGYSEQGLSNFGAAREDFLAALRIQKTLTPSGSMRQVSILNDLGNLNEDQKDLAAAHEYYAEALTISERLVPGSSQLATILENLTFVEVGENELTAARDHIQRAMVIREAAHEPLWTVLIGLGGIAFKQNDFAAARAYCERYLASCPLTNPSCQHGLLPVLSDLMQAAQLQGDLTAALEYGRQALAIHYDDLELGIITGEIWRGMGDILRDQGDLSAAADDYGKSMDILEKLAPESLHMSDTLVSLAKVVHAQQNRNLAIEYERRALKLGQKSCPNSWCVPGILNDLGDLAYEQGDFTGAERYFRQAVDIREESLGPAHPDLARSLNSLALNLAAQHRAVDALATALRAERIGAEHLRVSVRTLAERQAMAYEGIRASGLDVALTLAADRAASTPSARSQIFDAVIRSRALVFDELAARHRSAYGSGDPEVAQLANQLSSARTRLATLVFQGVGDFDPAAYRKLLDEARQGKENAERMLAEKSLAFREEQARSQLGLKEIAASLPPGTALVAFVRYARHDLQKSRADKALPKPVPSYAAFVLQAGAHEPVFVPLGGAREIESLLTAWRRDITRPAEVMAVSSTTSDDSYRRAGAALRRRIWDPLIPGLGAARKVFVVPDAALHLVSLASLPVGSSQYLVETGPLIHYLSAERDLVPAQSQHGEGILVVGNPAFDQAGKLVVAGNKPSALASATAGPTGTLLRGTRSACGTFQTLRFPPLPGSQQEAENIAALWKLSTGEGAQIVRGSTVQPGSGELLQMTGADASPEAFEQHAPGKQVLHVATHGFFLEGSCESAVQRRLEANKGGENFLPATAENPLLLSGLAFAGANRRASAKPDETDGILTAEEIAGINLEGVDWAVLSACDTGVGEIKVGEGVFGLRRAFQVAGAKTVIMSLWPVEDEMTRQWMGSLYREHFLNGKDTAESVRAASLQVLRQRRAKHQSAHPFYWGAFIAAGDWH